MVQMQPHHILVEVLFFCITLYKTRNFLIKKKHIKINKGERNTHMMLAHRTGTQKRKKNT